ncbi:YfhO family protein [Lentilactobacillus kisonensis]|uniref:Bacterial membrane protein YfhO n=1 Tax=Lentilactobacillus kisonensis DSM 19906 = JCM 15041 TaxID=1423766 RepID=A0A0R1P1I5_9LACO|nr:YfhO family protein [Lentilactobacillus kisonensis]KRL22699.1 bacterial membrane protein YfhO [Lentilactobacillus kisonensis DSM 19906 = JCM 15041]
MLRKNLSAHKLAYYIWTIMVPLIIISGVFMTIGIAPFGNHNLLISDLSTQYLQFFAELRRELLHLSFPSYSFLISIGDSLVPIYSYYLLSPLNLIIVFFRPAQLPIAIDLIIWMKIILCSVSMSIFLGKKYQSYDFMGICGGLAYGLCGFVAMYFYDLMWLDALIWLPVMVYGLEKLFYRNKGGIYVIGLVAIILTNYYMGYIICVFAIIYFAYLMKQSQPIRQPFFQHIKAHSRKVSQFLWYSLISGMLAAVVLIPTVVAMLSTGKKDISLTNFLLKGTFGPSFAVNLGVGGNDFAGRLVHNPSLFTGSLFIIGAVAYFFSRKIKLRNKQAAGILLGSILIGMWLLPLNTFWHMMQQPAGFPFRMVFLFSFALIMVAYEGYLKGVFAERKVILWSAIGIGAALLIGYVTANLFQQKMDPFKFQIPQLMVSNSAAVLAIGFLVVTTLAILAVAAKRPASKAFLVVILALELMVNFSIATSGAPFGNQQSFERTYAKSERLVGKVESKERAHHRFYRMLVINQPFRQLFKVPYSGYNDSFIFQNHGLSSYSSTLNSHTHHVLANLGFSSRNIRRIDMFGSTRITQHLLGLKYVYYIGAHEHLLMTQKNVAGLGFMTSSRMQHLKFIKDQPFRNQNRLVQAEMGNSEQYFERPTIVKTSQQTFRDFYQYQVELRARTTGPHYLYLPKVRLHGVKFYINGRKLSSLYSGLGTEMIPVGNLQRNQATTITVKSTKKLPDPASHVDGINAAKFDRAANTLNRHQLKLQDNNQLDWHGGHFRGKARATNQKRILLMSMPYDKGWQVKVDGRNRPVKKVASGLVGVELPVGTHRLAFNYHIRGLLTGAIFSLVGLLLLIGTVVLKRTGD